MLYVLKIAYDGTEYAGWQRQKNALSVQECLEEAVKTASSLAEAGDCVVLSPAAASFDMFKNFAVRGETFKKIVKEL